jgi:hypothetical protein
MKKRRRRIRRRINNRILIYANRSDYDQEASCAASLTLEAYAAEFQIMHVYPIKDLKTVQIAVNPHAIQNIEIHLHNR